MAMAMAVATSATAGADAVSRGERLFEGTEPLAGTLSGHDASLPPAATRCVHCHAGPGKASAATAGMLPLGPHHLLEARARRGGPPVAYDQASFCRTLRTGIDPASIILPRSMPRFEVDDAQCAALWAYLIGTARQ